MQEKQKSATFGKSSMRIIDVNLNRLNEALRVLEDIARFALNESQIHAYFKEARHRLKKIISRSGLDRGALLEAREARRDVGRLSTQAENSRHGLLDIYLANMSRLKEALRVLEEISKLESARLARDFKSMRFRVYEIEKKGKQRIDALRDIR